MMKKAGLLIVLMILITLSLNAQQLMTVKSVVDFNRIVLSNGEKIILIGVCAPEKQPEAHVLFLASKAIKYMKSVLRNNRVYVIYDSVKQATFESNYAYLITEDGENLNESLIKKGLTAFSITDENRMFKRNLKYAQELAQKFKKGIWEHYQEKPPVEVYNSRKHQTINKIFDKWLKK
ncbi:thermonuclease family protein [bacterium]|nr:thermonuclease family protein [bacterium]